MTVPSENQYLQSLFQELTTTYETEISYDPLPIKLDREQCTIADIPSLNHFLAEHRKRLFIFNIPGQDAENHALALRARRFILSQTAEHALKNSTHGPQINPLKRGLTTPETSVRAGIQIQKSFALPEQNVAIKKTTNRVAEEVHAPELSLQPIDFKNLPNLIIHLNALGITQIDRQAQAKINDYPEAFTDGLIPNNLPCGFYINHEMQALCYTKTPTKLPTNLAPLLKRIEPSLLPTFEIARSIVPNAISDDMLKELLDEKNSSSQHNALVHVLPNYKDKIEPLLKLFTPNLHEAIIPIIAKMFVFGGEAHSTLVCTLLSTCIKKNICLEFLSKPEMHTALLTPQGIKNLQKLIALPQEQRVWWNTLVASHLKNEMHSFDFNQLFEAYAQIFIPKIQEKKLTLPTPCPINHDGHMLLTLNRIQEVLEHAANPQEQCMSLSNLNWGPTGVHFAMTQVSASKRLKQAASCMNVATPDDLEINLDTLHEQLNDQEIKLKPSLFRFMGQHWNAKIEFKTIHAQWHNIEQNTALDPIEKRQLLFITTASFPASIELDSTQWVNHLNACVSLLQSLEASVKKEIFGLLSHCHQFKPIPSIVQLNTLITLCIELKKTNPSSLAPFSSFLQHEGFDLLQTLNERFEKNKMDTQQSLRAIVAFSKTIDKERKHLSPMLINLLAKLNEMQIDANALNSLNKALNQLMMQKGDDFYQLTLNTLAQINISKSQELPTSAQIQTLLIRLQDSNATIPAEQNTAEKQEAWLKAFIVDQNLLPGCILGNGDISKLDDLLVDALSDAIKKRSAALNVSQLKQTLQKHLASRLVPEALRDQLDKELMPVFDALDQLVNLLKQPAPDFASVLEKLKIFEDKKPTLLNGEYSVFLGKSKGEFLLSLLLTGTKKEPQDTITGSVFSSILVKLHQLFISEMDGFFADAQNMQSIKDLNTQIALSWMRSFNETHALTFFFKEELIEKKIIPALKKTLKQLHTEDETFEAHILEAATHLQEHGRSDDALNDYKLKIESIAKYLNLMIDIKDTYPDKFKALLTQLNNSTLNRLNFNQKTSLIPVLLQQGNESLANYLTTLSHILDDHPEAQVEAIERAVGGIVELFGLDNLDPETKTMFFKMSVSHNLMNASPFPLTALNKLRKSGLPETAKSLIIKQIIHVLCRMPAMSASSINDLVSVTQSLLIDNPQYIDLCIALLKKINYGNISRDINAYTQILSQIKTKAPEVSNQLKDILTKLANNKKDDTVNLSTLLEITKGLARSEGHLGHVLTLFNTPPYPTALSLNSALIAPDAAKLEGFCQNFDTNPHAQTGEQRNFAAHFATDRIKESLLNLKDLLHDVPLPHSLEIKLAEQLTYIELLGYTDPLNPQDVTGHKKLTHLPRHELKDKAASILNQLRTEEIAPKAIELKQLELLAYLREIYFRAIGIFPNTTQMLILLLSIHQSKENLLMSIKTGEGKSIITPILSVLQWAQGGTVNQCTANPTLLIRDYENSCEPFFTFLGIDSALIQSDSHPKQYKLDGINCSTIEDLSLFQLAAKESNQEHLLQNNKPIHLVLDECDDALLDQTTLYKLVREQDASTNEQNHAQWIYPLAHQFINLQSFQNTDPSKGAVWDEEMDLDEFRLFLNKAINESFQGDAQKQNFIMASSKTQLRQWIDASCRAATFVKNKHFLIQPLKVKDESGQEKIKKNICVPLIRSTPKTGSIFTEGVHQALQARLIAEQGDGTHYLLSIDSDPQVLSSQSARGLIKKCQKTQGRLVGISATPGNIHELQGLFSLLGTQAFGFAPHAGDKRKKHQPIFTYSQDGRIMAIHAAINQIKCPITKPTMELNAKDSLQTYEDQEALMRKRKKALEEWNQTQTQPILIINEDFDEANILGDELESFKQEGFEIQIVTGKETDEELGRIIKKAGQCNTITVGTAMLAKGIDINTGNHPKGLFVIQSYPDTERMSTQISGRAARNGKPGEWLPIYEIKPPKNFFQKLLYYIFPSYRKKFNKRTIEKLTNQMQTQATIERLYTQAIDEVQDTIMQQVEAWEGFLRELYPEDSNLSSELYQWREAIQSELAHIQEMHISQQTLQESINKFKLSAQKLWETMREAQWMVKAQQKDTLDEEQTLRFKYLKQIDLDQECSVQSGLHQQKATLKEATVARANQNLDSVLVNKAGVYLNYQESTLSDDEKNKLLLAQKIQLLPYLLSELCSAYPQAIDTVCPENKFTGLHFLPKAINTWFGNLIHKKNKFFLNAEKERLTKQSIVASVQQQLAGTTEETVNQLLNRIKPVLIAFNKELSSQSLVTQFKMHGLMGQFINLYPSPHASPNDPFAKLKEDHSTELSRQLLLYLVKEFAWVDAKPKPFHALLERAAGIEAAQSIYTLASSLLGKSIEPQGLQTLYTELQKHRIVLKDVYLCSISHTSPREVIKTALSAIDSIAHAPHCDSAFRAKAQDKALAQHHLSLFSNCLEKASAPYVAKNDTLWSHLSNILNTKINPNDKYPIHHILELYETVERFKQYESYKPYKKHLNRLAARLLDSLNVLNGTEGLNEHLETHLLNQKQKDIASLLGVNPDKVCIQRGSNGIESYIEVQVEGAPSLNDGFSGYQSTFFTQLEQERIALKNKRQALEAGLDSLFNSADAPAHACIPEGKKAKLSQLIQIQSLLNQNIEAFDEKMVRILPTNIQHLITRIKCIKAYDWTIAPQDDSKITTIFTQDERLSMRTLLDAQAQQLKSLQEKQQAKEKLEAEILEKQAQLAEIEQGIQGMETQKNDPNCSFFELARLKLAILNAKGMYYWQNNLIALENTLTQIRLHEASCCTQLDELNAQLMSHSQNLCVTKSTEVKTLLTQYVEQQKTVLIQGIGEEYERMDASIEKIQKQELHKSRYQVRRFFNSRELLRYEAELSQEQKNIPQKAIKAKNDGISIIDSLCSRSYS